MTPASENNTIVRDRLKFYNPFVVGLDDRHGVKQDNLEFFDGRDRLVRQPMAEFDGRPLSRGRRYFIPAVSLVAIAVASPLFPFYGVDSWERLFIVAGLFVACATALIGATAYHLNNIRKDYTAANRELMVTDFLIKAQGVRKVLYLFKVVVRWRRFLRYTLNVGVSALIAVFALSIFGLGVRGTLGSVEFAISAILFLVGLAFIALFEIVRFAFTRGMDPTLALVLMVEDIGAQLLASRRPANVIQTAVEPD